MGKALAFLGFLLIIIGILPIILPMVGFPQYATYFYLNIYTLPLAGYQFSEVMLGLIGLGFILLIVGAIK